MRTLDSPGSSLPPPLPPVNTPAFTAPSAPSAPAGRARRLERRGVRLPARIRIVDVSRRGSVDERRRSRRRRNRSRTRWRPVGSEGAALPSLQRDTETMKEGPDRGDLPRAGTPLSCRLEGDHAASSNAGIPRIRKRRGRNLRRRRLAVPESIRARHAPSRVQRPIDLGRASAAAIAASEPNAATAARDHRADSGDLRQARSREGAGSGAHGPGMAKRCASSRTRWTRLGPDRCGRAAPAGMSGIQSSSSRFASPTAGIPRPRDRGARGRPGAAAPSVHENEVGQPLADSRGAGISARPAWPAAESHAGESSCCDDPERR